MFSRYNDSIYFLEDILDLFAVLRAIYKSNFRNRIIIILSTVCLVCATFIGGWLYNNYSNSFVITGYQEDVKSVTNIHSLYADNTTNGKFYLGTGSIEGEEYYSYMKIDNDGALIKAKINSDNVRIYEKENT